MAKPVKNPVTAEMCKAIAEDAPRKGSLGDIRLAAACLLAFAGFLMNCQTSGHVTSSLMSATLPLPFLRAKGTNFTRVR